jgi:hypothetical protein
MRNLFFAFIIYYPLQQRLGEVDQRHLKGVVPYSEELRHLEVTIQ